MQVGYKASSVIISVCDDGGLVDAVIFVTRRNGGLFMHFGE